VKEDVEGAESDPPIDAERPLHVDPVRPQLRPLVGLSCPKQKAGVHEDDAHPKERGQVVDKVLVIIVPNAVGYPGTVVIESGHAFVAQTTVLGADGSSNQTSAAEPGRIEPLFFRQRYNGSTALFLTRIDLTRITPPGPVKAVEENRGHHNKDNEGEWR
jgi:hypothetical protein